MGFIRTSIFVAILSCVAYGVYEHQVRGIKFADPDLPANKLPPWPVFNIAMAITDGLRVLVKTLTPPNVHVMELTTAYWGSTILYAFAKLEIGDALRDKPLTCEEVAAQLATPQPVHTPFLCRFLAGAEHVNLVARTEDGKFRVTEAGLLTSRGGLDGVTYRDFIFLENEESAQSMYQLPKTIQTGKPGFDLLFKDDWWTYMGKHNDKYRQFDRAMQQVSTDMPIAIVGDVSFANDSVVCDIGGGRGHVLAEVLIHYPKATGKLFDLPGTVLEGREYFGSIGLESRAAFIPGSFLDSVEGLEDCDTFIIKSVLLDWPDKEAVQILSNIRNIMKPTARVLVPEMVLGEGSRCLEKTKHVIDTVMMAVLPSGAQTRSAQGYAALGEQAGLEMVKLYPTRSMLDVIEFKPKAKTA